MTVVVAFDDSEFAAVVADHAVHEAERRGAELHALHVFQLPWSLYVSYGAPPIDAEKIRRYQLDRVWSIVDPVIAKSSQTVRKVELEGYPPDGVLAYAADVDAEVIVVGSRGLGDFRSMMLGSTSHKIIQGATCDVLVVAPHTKSDVA